MQNKWTTDTHMQKSGSLAIEITNILIIEIIHRRHRSISARPQNRQETQTKTDRALFS
jgi:hypothetical protein